jgi:hypothetical protein
MKSPWSVRIVSTACPCHPQGPLRQTGPDEELSFQKLDILTIAKAIIREVPAVENTPMILVRDGQDR